MVSRIFNKVKFLAFCWYRGHIFGVNQYLKRGEDLVCARCGYKKKRKKIQITDDDYFVY